MNPAHPRDTRQRKFGGRIAIFSASAFVVLVYALAFFFLFPAGAAQRDLPPNSLWEVVHYLCVPGQTQFHNPTPCVHVDLNGGMDGGFAILRDPRGGTQFLLIPTTRISGIESPIVRGPGVANYFADAWASRTYISDALHQSLPRDGIALAINSASSRSQDQLHIHLSCIRSAALDLLHKNERKIGDRWALLNAPLDGHYYSAMWVAGEDLSAYNPFRLLAEGVPNAMRNMGDRTLVVVGMTRSDGTKGFVILSDQANKENGDQAFGEELLDRDCRIVAAANKTQASPKQPRAD